MEVRKIGTNAITATIGEPSPTTATMNPSVAARLYAGAVEATPMTVAETSPRAPVLSPFSTCSSMAPGGAAFSAVAITYRPSTFLRYATICEVKRTLSESFRRPTRPKPPKPEVSGGQYAPGSAPCHPPDPGTLPGSGPADTSRAGPALEEGG